MTPLGMFQLALLTLESLACAANPKLSKQTKKCSSRLRAALRRFTFGKYGRPGIGGVGTVSWRQCLNICDD
jgi:hypothetical protein